MKKSGKNTLASYLMIIMGFVTACSSATGGMNDDAEIKTEHDILYQVSMTEGMTALAEYYRGGGIVTAHHIPEEWESDVFTVQHGTELKINVSGEIQDDWSEIKIRIFVDGKVADGSSLLHKADITDPDHVELFVSHVVGE